MNYCLDIELVFVSHYVISPRWCYSTEDYNEHTDIFYHNIDDDDEKLTPDWLYLPYCDESKEYIEFTNNKCSQHLSHRVLVTCKCFQNDLDV